MALARGPGADCRRARRRARGGGGRARGGAGARAALLPRRARRRRGAPLDRARRATREPVDGATTCATRRRSSRCASSPATWRAAATWSSLRSQLAQVRMVEQPPGIEEAEEAALALERVIGAPPRVASPAYLDAVGVGDADARARARRAVLAVLDGDPFGDRHGGRVRAGRRARLPRRAALTWPHV